MHMEKDETGEIKQWFTVIPVENFNPEPNAEKTFKPHPALIVSLRGKLLRFISTHGNSVDNADVKGLGPHLQLSPELRRRLGFDRAETAYIYCVDVFDKDTKSSYTFDEITKKFPSTFKNPPKLLDLSQDKIMRELFGMHIAFIRNQVIDPRQEGLVPSKRELCELFGDIRCNLGAQMLQPDDPEDGSKEMVEYNTDMSWRSCSRSDGGLLKLLMLLWAGMKVVASGVAVGAGLALRHKIDGDDFSTSAEDPWWWAERILETGVRLAVVFLVPAASFAGCGLGGAGLIAGCVVWVVSKIVPQVILAIAWTPTKKLLLTPINDSSTTTEAAVRVAVHVGVGVMLHFTGCAAAVASGVLAAATPAGWAIIAATVAVHLTAQVTTHYGWKATKWWFF
ncbi:hypothetical protein MKEN_01045900 [Mycena kentingensis (nom. inval.)]|nr:hypothetical protein MKEN_01045900 [Mycena kentingensis (nom. inval.)]